MEPRPQDWRVLLGMFCFSSVIEITAWGHLQAFAPLFLDRELGMDAADVPFWTGVLAALPLCVAVPLAPFWGVLADRYSRKLFILRSLGIEVVAYLIAAFSHSLLAFIVARLLMGLAFGNNALAVAVLSLAVPDRRLGTAVGLFTTMFPIGLSVGPLLGSALIAVIGLRGMYAVDSGLTLVAALVLAFGVREPRRSGAALGLTVRQQLGAVFGTVARTPVIRWNFVLWFLVGGGIAGMDPYVPVLIGQVYRGPALAATIGLVLAVFGVASGICTPLAARLADRIGEPRTLALASLALALVAFALPLSGTVVVVGALLLLRAAPQAATNPALFTHLARHTPREQRGGVMAVSPLPRNIGQLAIPLAGSVLSAWGLGAVFGLCGLLFLGALGFTRPLERAAQPSALPAPQVGDA